MKHIKGGLQNSKAKYIRETAAIIKNDFGGKMPRSLKDLQVRLLFCVSTVLASVTAAFGDDLVSCGIVDRNYVVSRGK